VPVPVRDLTYTRETGAGVCPYAMFCTPREAESVPVRDLRTLRETESVPVPYAICCTRARWRALPVIFVHYADGERARARVRLAF
jgi:hypothetical protein